MSSKLFQPTKVGDLTLNHRVVLAPLTRTRASDDHVPGSLAVEYYTQRASIPGTLLISEATFISPQSGGMRNVPGIYTEEQISEWKKITDAIHSKGSYVYMQMWALGRAADPDFIESEGHPYVSASPIPLRGSSIAPRALTTTEIKEYVQRYEKAASDAVFKAGFDGVEIHGAHGYLLDQFLQDMSNQRTDEYGGSIENRTRFPLEVIEAVTKAVGAHRTAIRLSPWNRFQDMAMEDPIPTFSHLVTRIRDLYPSFAYLHVVEPRVDGATSREVIPEDQSNDFLREIWGSRPFVSAGGFTRELAIEFADKKGDLVAFGRPFISNPDLPLRLQTNTPLVKGDRETYQGKGRKDVIGYTDYPAVVSIKA